MKRHLYHIVLLALLASFRTASAQDIHFSQFFETPLLRNPALAGIFTGDYRIQTVFRDQWNSFTNAYRTGSLNGEYKWPVGRSSDYFTTAFEVLYDKAGTAALTTTELLPALNYHKSLSNEKAMYLSVGFMGGLVTSFLLELLVYPAVYAVWKWNFVMKRGTVDVAQLELSSLGGPA